MLREKQAFSKNIFWWGEEDEFGLGYDAFFWNV